MGPEIHPYLLIADFEAAERVARRRGDATTAAGLVLWLVMIAATPTP